MKENLEHLDTAESLISEFLQDYLRSKKITLKSRTSSGLWLGMTYKEDLEEVKQNLENLKKSGEYPTHIW